MKINQLFNIEGKTALITGSTGGLGNAFARGLCANGANVILHGRNEEKLESQMDHLKKEGYQVSGYPFDLTKTSQTENTIKKIIDEYGRIDILVNNAGINIRNPLENFEDADWDSIIATNLTGVYKVSKAVAKHMIARKSGKIINIGSMQCELGRAGITPYAASKGGLKMLTRGMAVEWAVHNIQVNGIGPGYFKTAMTKSLYENREFDQWLCNRTPSRRWGIPDELTGALIFLASPASNFVNGQMIYVDGGLLASI